MKFNERKRALGVLGAFAGGLTGSAIFNISPALAWIVVAVAVAWLVMEALE